MLTRNRLHRNHACVSTPVVATLPVRRTRLVGVALDSATQLVDVHRRRRRTARRVVVVGGDRKRHHRLFCVAAGGASAVLRQLRRVGLHRCVVVDGGGLLRSNTSKTVYVSI